MKKLSKMRFFFSEIKCFEGVNNGLDWIQLLKVGNFKHPAAPGGVLKVDPAFLQKLLSNFEMNVRKLDKGELAVDYSHNDGEKAAGWIKELELKNNDSELWAKVDWTKTGLQMIEDKEFRFVSPDIHLDYTDNETGVSYGSTLLGAGLTNRPHIKGMRALLEERDINKGVTTMEEELKKQIAELQRRVAELESALKAKTTETEAVMAEKVKMAGEKDGAIAKCSELEAKLVKLEGDAVVKEKEIKFSELLAAGKVTPAQKDVFMKMDVKLAEEFAKSAPVLNFSDKGHGTDANAGKKDDKVEDVQDQIKEKALKFMEADKGLSFSEAARKVLLSDPELNKKYNSVFEQGE